MRILQIISLCCWLLSFTASATQVSVTVHKTPTCGCCEKWVNHLHAAGYEASTVEHEDLSAIKSAYSIQGRYRSCHTGVVSTLQGDYVFEGHVPARFIDEFLENPPAGALGLSVPGMPVGSPGMEVGDRKDYYQVLLLKNDGSAEIYAHVNAPE